MLTAFRITFKPLLLEKTFNLITDPLVRRAANSSQFHRLFF